MDKKPGVTEPAKGAAGGSAPPAAQANGIAPPSTQAPSAIPSAAAPPGASGVGAPINAIGRNSPQKPFPGMNHGQDQNGGRWNNPGNKQRGKGRPNFGNDNRNQNQNSSPSIDASSSKDAKPEVEGEAKKFTNRARLFVGNLSNDTNDEDLRKMFEKYAPEPEVFLDRQKMFAFIKMDTRANAEIAKSAIDGITFKGRILRVRFATHNAGLRIKNLSQNVSNELLHRAFERFGEIERAVVSVDERGKPSGEGIVYFARKPNAFNAFRQISEGVFLLGCSPRPIHAEILDQKDTEDGLPEVHVASRQAYQQETSEPPRFAQNGTLEFEFGMRWKKLFENHQKKLEELEKLFQDASETLEKEMERSIDDLEVNKIKQTIMQEQMRLRDLEQRQAQRRQQLGQQNSLLQMQPNPLMSLGAPLPPPGFGAMLPNASGIGANNQTSASSTQQQQSYTEHIPLLPQAASMMTNSTGSNFPGGQVRMPAQFGGVQLPGGGPTGFMHPPPRYITSSFEQSSQQQQQQQQYGEMGMGPQQRQSRPFDNKRSSGTFSNLSDSKRPRS